MEGTPDLTEHIFPGAPVNVQAEQPDLYSPFQQSKYVPTEMMLAHTGIT